MAYATVDENNRIIEWSYEHLDGMDIEFSNGDYIDANCVNGVEDFKIINGQAVYDPLERPQTSEERIAELEAALELLLSGGTE